MQKSARKAHRKEFLKSQYKTKVPYYSASDLPIDECWEPYVKVYSGWDFNAAQAFTEGQDENTQQKRLKSECQLNSNYIF